MKKNMYKEQKVIINEKSLNLKDTFECGQCFRWNKELNGSYTGIIKNGIINISKEKDCFVINGICNEDLLMVVNNYLDLNRDYSNIMKKLSKVDKYLSESIKYGKGIRLLNQDLWEMIISYIISANNNIPRIKGIIEKLSQKYGQKILWQNKEYYLFPTIEELSKANVEDLRKLGLGFRDVRVYETTKLFWNKKITLDELHQEKNLDYLREKLIFLPGVGPKVADCIMLFSTLKRLDVFPIDVWVRRVMNDLYIHNPDEKKVSKKEIYMIAKEKFGDLSGIAQQYLYYWKRSN